MIPLLPRNINNMSFLDKLDLRNNILKGLPTEFADVLESVPEVSIVNNPWTDFPPIWGRIMTNNWTQESPNGYLVADALEFMYNLRVIYYQAEEIWLECGPHHYSNRLDFNDFLSDLKAMLGPNWRPEFEKSASLVYFKAKEFGVFPRWYHLDEEDKQHIIHRKAADALRRDMMVERVKEEERKREEDKSLLYERDVVRRAMRKEELHAELNQNKIIRENVAYASLYADIRRKRDQLEIVASNIETDENNRIAAERERLLSVTASAFEDRRLASAKERKRKQKKKRYADIILGNNHIDAL